MIYLDKLETEYIRTKLKRDHVIHGFMVVGINKNGEIYSIATSKNYEVYNGWIKSDRLGNRVTPTEREWGIFKGHVVLRSMPVILGSGPSSRAILSVECNKDNFVAANDKQMIFTKVRIA